MESSKASLLATCLLVAFPMSSAHGRPPPPCPALVPLRDAEVARAQLLEQSSFVAPALTLARSSNANHLRLLGKTLNSAALLSGRFDNDIGAIRCQLLPVLRALAENPTPEARRQYLRLLTARPFILKGDRIDALIRSSAMFKPAPRALVKFWRRYARPMDGFINLTVKALAKNGSRPAVRLFTSLLKDRRHDIDDRLSWIRWDVLENRHGMPLLQACRGLLQSRKLPIRMRRALVEALFDYRPDIWCRPDRCMRPPPREEMPSDARQELRLIAALALKMKLGERLPGIIKKTLAQLDRLDRKASKVKE